MQGVGVGSLDQTPRRGEGPNIWVNRSRKYKWRVAVTCMYELPRPNNMENYSFEAENEKEKHP